MSRLILDIVGGKRATHSETRLNPPTITKYTTVTATTTAFINPSAQVVSDAVTVVTILMHTVIVRVNGTITLTVTPTGAPVLKIVPITRTGSTTSHGLVQSTAFVKTVGGKSSGEKLCGSLGLLFVLSFAFLGVVSKGFGETGVLAM